jgi:N-acetyl-gamma-glutamyl-phosphate/LysW-gamma-L-alpha-aminoadipyl-6-phosphate reductase
VTGVAVVGAGGYIGGELVRLLLGHPAVERVTAISSRFAGRRVDSPHPNLRGLTDLRFSSLEELTACDVLFLATPHGQAMRLLPALAGRAKQVIDLSADFRLRDPAGYARWYGVPHSAPELLGAFVPGVPELFREELRGADLVSVPGCMATAAILALHPLAGAGLVEPEVLVDARSGSSGSGATAGEANLHAERSGAMRLFAPLGHRHETEIGQLTGLEVSMSATGVEAVRGVQVVCRARVRAGHAGLDERALRQLYRQRYAGEPFVRIVAQRRGVYRYPEPKILAGSNFCDIGFAIDEASGQLVAVAALDNLMKGGAGNAVQCLNIRMGWPERSGLEFAGLHPI